MNDVGAALRGIVGRKAFLIALGVGALLLASMVGEAVMLNGAAVDADIALDLHNDYVVKVLGTWNLAVALFAVYLGAAAVPPKLGAARTPGYLATRWTAALIVLSAFSLAGLAVGLGIAHYLGAPHTSMVWVAAAAAFVSPALSSGMSLMLAVVMSPVIAGFAALAVSVFMPPFVDAFLRSPQAVANAIAHAVYYLAPADLPYDVLRESFDMELIAPAYTLYGQVLAENLLYTAALVATGCVLLAKRERTARRDAPT